MFGAVALSVGAGFVALYKALDKYRLTSHGDNPWTIHAMFNVIRLQSRFEQAREILDGTITSVYRSDRVNNAVGGVKTSRHLRGLACDIKPKSLSPKDATDKLYAVALSGKLGAVHKVIQEPTIVHISWKDYDESAGAPKRGYWEKK